MDTTQDQVKHFDAEKAGCAASIRKAPTLEIPDRLETLRETYGATWTSPTDPEDPYNFRPLIKFFMGTIFSFGQLIPIMSASMIAPSLPAIARDLNISASTAQITLSAYFLGMAFGPFLIASASEIWGRKRVWVICNVIYCMWNALSPVGHKVGLMIVGRFLSGAGASAGVTLNGAVMADLYGEKDRGKSLAMVTLLPYLGPAIGPIIGGTVTELIRWDFVFYIMSAFNLIVLLLGTWIIRETYTPVLLRRKARAEGNTPVEMQSKKFVRAKMIEAFSRPFKMLLRQPIVWILSLIGTLSFGTYTLMLATYATLWIEEYKQSELISSLHYISIAIGATVTGQIGGHIMDYIYRTMSKRNGGRMAPEYRIPWMLVGVIIMPIGLFWYGWSAESKISWVMVDAGVVVFTCGSFIIGQANTAFSIGEFGEYAASASAARTCVSYILAFVYPIFAPLMYHDLGYGWGNSTLAFISIGLAFPCCAALWFFSSRLRVLGRGKQPA